MYVIVYIKINFIWPLRSLIFLWKTWYFFRSLWLNMIFYQFNASFLKSIKYNLLNDVIVYIKNNFIWHLFVLLLYVLMKIINSIIIYIVVFKWAFSTVVLIIKMFYGLK